MYLMNHVVVLCIYIHIQTKTILLEIFFKQYKYEIYNYITYYVLPNATLFNLHIPIQSNKISIKSYFTSKTNLWHCTYSHLQRYKKVIGVAVIIVGQKGRNAFVIPLYFLICPCSSYFFSVVYFGMIVFLLLIFGGNTTIV